MKTPAWLQKLSSRPALEKFRALLQEADAAVEKINGVVRSAIDYHSPEKLEAEYRAFLRAPDAKKFGAIAGFENQLRAIREVAANITRRTAGTKAAILSAGSATITAAFDEVRAGLVEQVAAVEAADDRRSQDQGVRVSDDAALAALARQIEQLDQGRPWITTDPVRAANALRTVAGLN
jgi:hypothetical protein